MLTLSGNFSPAQNAVGSGSGSLQQEASRQLYMKHAAIIYRCFRILKAKLSKYVPSLDTLHYLDEICKEVTVQLRDEQLLKPALYLRSVLSKLSQGKRRPAPSPTRLPPAQEPEEALVLQQATMTQEDPQSTSVSIAIPPQRLVPNMLVARHRVNQAPKKKKTVALLYCDLFSGPIELSQDTRGKRDLVYDDCFSCSEWPTKYQIGMVENTKKHEHLENNPHAPKALDTASVDKHLFRFKYYSEQIPVDLPESQLNTVFDKVASPVSALEENEEDRNERSAAFNVVIKILMDLYCTGDPATIQQMKTVFFEMMESDSPETQCSAFDLILNLSIHSHLLEDISPTLNQDQKSKDDSIQADQEVGGSLRVGVIQDDLFRKLKELILWIVHKKNTSSLVWESALNCFLYFSVADGLVDKSRLMEVDLRFLVNCMSIIKRMNDDTKHFILRMIMNQLYPKPSSEISLSTLSAIGGINWLLDVYVETRSQEVRDNMLVVIFDYIMQQLKRNKRLQFSQDQANLILEFLKSLDVAQYLAVIFKLVPDKFVERFVRFIYIEELKKDPDWFKIFGNVDKPLLVAILYDLEKLAQQYLRFQPEFLSLFEREKETVSLPEKDLKIIQSLLKSKHADENNQGCIWLFELMLFTLSEGFKGASAENGASFKKEVDNLLRMIMKSRDPSQRKVFLKIIEKLILDKKYRLNPMNESYKDDVLKLMDRVNDYLSKWIQTEEKDQDNLAYAVDFIFNLVSIPAQGTVMLLWLNHFLERAIYEIDSPLTSYYAAACEGRFLFKRNLLKMLNMNIFKWIFINLRHPTYETMRCLVLFWIIEIVSNGPGANEKLEELGGMAFIKDLIMKDSALDAYLASQYMANQLAAEKVILLHLFYLTCSPNNTKQLFPS